VTPNQIRDHQAPTSVHQNASSSPNTPVNTTTTPTPSLHSNSAVSILHNNSRSSFHLNRHMNKHLYPSQINCLYTNATSLVSKLTTLEYTLHLNNIDVAIITETWPQVTHLADIAGYKLYRKDRGSHGGGVCIYVKSTLTSYQLISPSINIEYSEQIWCVIKINSYT
jgi:hypothetical protein